MEVRAGAQALLLLLLLAGDVETNPGPPKRGGGEKKKELTKEEQMQILQNQVRDYEERIGSLETEAATMKQEVGALRATVAGMTGFETEVQSIKQQMENISGVYNDLNEKMHDVDKAIKNNLLFYGMVPDSIPELSNSLAPKVQDLFRYDLGITRQLPLKKLLRLTTGPEIRGCRPVLVTFQEYKDREEVFSKAQLLKRSNIYVSEDLSRKTREHRAELQKFMRQLKTRSPHKRCVIRYDKLYVDNEPYVWDEGEGRVLPARCVSPNRRPPSVQDRSESSLSVNFRTPQPSAGLLRAESVHSVNGHPEPFLSAASPAFGSSENMSLPIPTGPTGPLTRPSTVEPQAQADLPHIVEEEQEVPASKAEAELPAEEKPVVAVADQKPNGVTNNNEKIVDKNTQKILKSLSNGNKKTKK